jgi:hypothetical protein
MLQRLCRHYIFRWAYASSWINQPLATPCGIPKSVVKRRRSKHSLEDLGRLGILAYVYFVYLYDLLY